MNSLILSALFFSWSTFLNFFSQRLIESKEKFFLFPFFEIILSGIFLFLSLNSSFFIPYFILFSALGITILTDIKSMMISSFASLFLVPTGFLFSYFNMSPISITESVAAALIGYLSLYFINLIFFAIKKENGLGEGDMELLALIGSYLGFAGIWFSIMIGSFFGIAIAVFYMALKRKRLIKLPFGPFLSTGAILFALFKNEIISLIL